MIKPTEVYFMGTCLVDVFYPNAGLCAMRLLRREGINIHYPKNQSCCGQPAYNAGYRVDAQEVANAHMTAFPKDIPIIVPSGSCADMMINQWPVLFKGTPNEAEACAVAARTYELTSFLIDVLKIRLIDLGDPISVAIHTSCSARNGLKAADKIELLVGQLAQVEVRTQVRKKECCGFGGTFAVKQVDISGAMVGDKTDALFETGADMIVGQDSGCLMNIGCALDKQNRSKLIQHIAEFLWQRTERVKK